MEEREKLEAALKTDPKNPSAHINLARLEAAVWAKQADQANLGKLAAHLNSALETLPPAQHAQVAKFARDLQGRGADLASIIKSGAAPRLLAAIQGKSNGPAPAAAPRAAPAPAAAPQTAPARPAAASPPPPAGKRGGMKFKEVELGEPSNAEMKAWLDGNQIPELASSYPITDNFRTRRVIIDKIGEAPGPLALAGLVYIIAHEDDPKTVSYITKIIDGFDAGLLDSELSYDPADKKYKSVVVKIMAGRKSEACVEPLSLALRDPEAAIRVNAIQGLHALVGEDEDWVKQLGMIIRRDRDSKVRVEAAKGLKAIGPTALHELEAAAKESEFDASLTTVLEELREVFESQVKEKQRGAREKDKKEKKSSMIEEDKFSFDDLKEQMGKVLTAIALFAAAGLLGYGLWQKSKPQIITDGGYSDDIIRQIAPDMDPIVFRAGLIIEAYEMELSILEEINEERFYQGLPPLPSPTPLPGMGDPPPPVP